MEWLWIGGAAVAVVFGIGAVLRARAKRRNKEEATKDIYPMW